MKINANTLMLYYNTCGLGGTINSVKTNFGADSVFTSTKNAPNTVFINVKMNTGVFENYSPIGDIIIRSVDKFAKYLKSYKKTDIELTKTEEFVINVKNDLLEHDVILGGESVVEERLHDGSLLNIKDCSVVEVPYNSLMDAITQMADIGSERIIFDKKENELSMVIDNGNSSDKSRVKVPCDDVSINRTVLGKVLLEAVQVFDKDFPVIVEIGTDVPITFKQTTDILSIGMVIAPRIENE